jgi:hypothetical protein
MIKSCQSLKWIIELRDRSGMRMINPVIHEVALKTLSSKSDFFIIKNKYVIRRIFKKIPAEFQKLKEDLLI